MHLESHAEFNRPGQQPTHSRGGYLTNESVMSESFLGALTIAVTTHVNN